MIACAGHRLDASLAHQLGTRINVLLARVFQLLPRLLCPTLDQNQLLLLHQRHVVAVVLGQSLLDVSHSFRQVLLVLERVFAKVQTAFYLLAALVAEEDLKRTNLIINQ